MCCRAIVLEALSTTYNMVGDNHNGVLICGVSRSNGKEAAFQMTDK